MAPPMEDPSGGPNASMGFGDASQFASERQAVASTSGPAQPGTPPPPQAPPAQQAQQPQQPQPGQPQQGGPVQPMQPPPAAPTDAEGQGRLDLNQVFPPMPELQGMDDKPWRMQLRTFAYHPQAGPVLKKLADMIDKQHGPTY